jgi:hypothetical protein
MSFDTRERITLKADGAVTYESIPLLADAGDSWTGRWEARGDNVVLIMPTDRGAPVEIPLQIVRRRRGVVLSFTPKSWSEVFMVLPGDYAK